MQGFQVHTQTGNQQGTAFIQVVCQIPHDHKISINESNLLNFLQKSVSEVGTLFRLPECDTGVFVGQVHTMLTQFHRKMTSLLWALWFTMKVKFCRWIKVKTVHKHINHGIRPSNSATCAHPGKKTPPY